MCGICGIYDLKKAGRIDAGLLDKMNSALRHRGPDAEGKYFGFEVGEGSFKVGLGHRRLSIVDVQTGRQPMSNEAKTVWVVCDGEIYNFKELRQACEKRGHRFSTQCDVEVIVHLYEDYGADCVRHLRGMFAFAVWDASRRTVLLARDRMGQKPLYYAFFKNNLIFASEIKAILLFPDIARKVNWDAFFPYLTFQTLPAPLTMYQGICKLEPATTMSVAQDGSCAKDEYWDFFGDPQAVSPASEEASTARFLDALGETTRVHTSGNGPKGVFLSGGVDSSLITALLSRSGERLETFTAGFDGGEDYNEFGYAARVARTFGATHHQVSLKKEDFSEAVYRDLLEYVDEPLLGQSCIPYYFNSKRAAAGGCKVIFTGEGGDELFCGYPFWRRIIRYKKYSDVLSRFSPYLQNLLLGILKRQEKENLRYEQLKRSLNRQTLFWGSSDVFSWQEKQALLGTKERAVSRDDPAYEIVRSYFDRFSRSGYGKDYGVFMSYLDLKIKMAELFLRRMDFMSTANSLEVRNPMLDHNFVEAALRVPASFKIKNKTSKYLLKKIAEKFIPRECIYREKKGWGDTATQWYFRSFYDPSSVRGRLVSFAGRTGVFDPSYLAKLFAQGTSLAKYRQWCLYSFMLWHERWIENKEG